VNTVVRVVIYIIILAAIGAGVYHFYGDKLATAMAPKPPAAEAPAAAPAAETPAPAAETPAPAPAPETPPAAETPPAPPAETPPAAQAP
jgi:hypothetical protein